MPTASFDDGKIWIWYVPAARPVKLYDPSEPGFAPAPTPETLLRFPWLSTLCSCTVSPAKPASSASLTPKSCVSR